MSGSYSITWWQCVRTQCVVGNASETVVIQILPWFRHLHDIGKGGDCIKYCDDHDVCWYAVYNTERYFVEGKQKDDGYHPNFSGQILMGQRPFYLSCTIDSRDVLDVPNLVASLGEQVDPREVALASYMHWEVGRLNIGKPEEFTDRLRRWYDLFMISCARVGLVPTESFLYRSSCGRYFGRYKHSPQGT